MKNHFDVCIRTDTDVRINRGRALDLPFVSFLTLGHEVVEV